MKGTKVKTKIVVEDFIKAQEFWNSLPVELLTEIFSHLSPRSLVRCSMVCKKWKIAANQEVIKKAFCKRYSLFLPATIPESPFELSRLIWSLMQNERQVTRTGLMLNPLFLDSSFVRSEEKTSCKNE